MTGKMFTLISRHLHFLSSCHCQKTGSNIADATEPNFPFSQKIKRDVVIHLDKIIKRQDYNIVCLDKQTKFIVSRVYRNNLRQKI